MLPIARRALSGMWGSGAALEGMNGTAQHAPTDGLKTPILLHASAIEGPRDRALVADRRAQTHVRIRDHTGPQQKE